jgi:hypothetical protein
MRGAERERERERESSIFHHYKFSHGNSHKETRIERIISKARNIAKIEAKM